jgi:hypothetical protein
MDLSQLPGAWRTLFDERGFLMDEQKKNEEAALEAAREKVKEINEVSPMGETEKEMTIMGLINPEGNTAVPPELESHEVTAKPTAEAIEDIDPESHPSSPVAGEVADEDEGDTGKKLRGKLPDDFPGATALTEAGHGTYAKARALVAKGDKWYADIPGIGEATAVKIEEALGEDE